MSGNAIFKASTRGYKRKAGQLSKAGRKIQPEILAEFRGELSAEALAAARGAAPHRSGDLSAGLQAPVSSRGGTVVVTLRSTVRSDDRTHYPYTNVTRFGHRKAIIKPKKGKRLRFESLGRFWELSQVRGYKPGGDWVEDAEPEIIAATDAAGDRLGRTIVASIQ